MGADDLAMQGSRASPTMIMTLLNQDNSFHAYEELNAEYT